MATPRGSATAMATLIEEGFPMNLREVLIAMVSATVLVFCSTAFGQQYGGTAAEAKAMLARAIAAVKADKAKALDMFNKGEGGFSTAISMSLASVSLMTSSLPSATPMENTYSARTRKHSKI
jgi:hypothetical protein